MNTKTVLLIEDNPRDEALTLRAFAKAGISNEVTVMRDGAEALDYLFRTGGFADEPLVKPPTVILLDLNLPKIGGLEVLRRIRADSRTELLPVVILTSSAQDEDRLKEYMNGANSYVRKPVEFTAFANAIQQAGLYWLILNELPPPTLRTEPSQ